MELTAGYNCNIALELKFKNKGDIYCNEISEHFYRLVLISNFLLIVSY